MSELGTERENTPTHECVYCGEEYTFIGDHHREEHPSKRYDPVWYLDGVEHRPPCEAVAHIDPGPPESHYEMERRVCPNCRLYFDVGAESDVVFCSGACERRHERGCYAG